MKYVSSDDKLSYSRTAYIGALGWARNTVQLLQRETDHS